MHMYIKYEVSMSNPVPGGGGAQTMPMTTHNGQFMTV